MKHFGWAASFFTAVLVVLNLSGFSYSKRRWLGDNELIKIAVEAEIRRDRVATNYSSFDEFIDENPECCRVIRGPEFQQLFGWYVSDVEIIYKISSGWKYSRYEATYSVDSSGNIRNFRGMERM